jgi:hypothetical protein
MNNANINAIADELGQLAAQIAELTARQDALKKDLIDAGVDVVEGDLFRATVTEVHPSPRVDFAAIVAKLNPSRQLVAAHTHDAKSYHRVVVKARVAA